MVLKEIMPNDESHDPVKRAKVQRMSSELNQLMVKYDVKVDQDTEILVREILEGYNLRNPQGILLKDWAICEAMRRAFDTGPKARSSTRQRSFEFLCELLGFTTGRKSAGELVGNLEFPESK